MGKIAPAKIVLAGIFVMLLAFAPGVYAHAESKVTQVRYEVSATVVYIDGEVQTTQKVPTGTTLKNPNLLAHPISLAGGIRKPAASGISTSPWKATSRWLPCMHPLTAGVRAG